MVRINEIDLGAIIKAARVRKGLKQEKLAEIAGVGLRHMQGIENEGSYPSYDVLYKIIRELHIPADTIFYPEKRSKDAQLSDILPMLYSCNEGSINIIRATVKAVIENQLE